MTAPFNARDLERFRVLVARDLGLLFDDSKLTFLAEVLRRRLDADGRSVEAYLSRLDASGGRDEAVALARELTIAETYFFRNIEQFHAFAEVALPDRLRVAQAAGRPVRIVSAGCASGEEPYTLAMLVRASGAAPTDVSITALDLNPANLERAKRGRYSAWALRETSPDAQRLWFRQEGKEFVIDESVRRAVKFEVCNLVDERSAVWQPDTFDVIFCRNVLMYFGAERAQTVVTRFARALRPGGYLFLGHAETLRGLSNNFHLHHTHNTFYYERKAQFLPDPVVDTPRASTLVPATTAVLAESVDGTDTWVDAIRRASQRIDALASSGQSSPSQEPPVRARRAVPAWDLGLALELLREERYAEALALVAALPPESARDTEVLLLQAVLLTHSSQFAEAERVCQRLLELDGMNAGAHYLLALCREGGGDRTASTHHDQVAIYLDPNFAMPHLHLGLLARRAGDHPAARRELEQALLLLRREDASRLLLFGGGFGREALATLCRSELVASGGTA